MKRVIRLTESDLVNIVKKVIIEQEAKEFKPEDAQFYLPSPNDRLNWTGMFFVSNGNTFDVWIGMRVSNEEVRYEASGTLPMLSEMEVKLKDDAINVELINKSKESNDIYTKIAQNDRGVVVTNDREKKPMMGILGVKATKFSVESMKPVDPVPGNTIMYDVSYFKPSRKNDNFKLPNIVAISPNVEILPV